MDRMASRDRRGVRSRKRFKAAVWMKEKVVRE
jgi:hypothetical protein